MRFRKTLPTLALASTVWTGGLLATLPEANAQLSVNISLGDEQYRPLRLGLSDYFNVGERDVLYLNQRGLRASEVPVALFIANRARVSPRAIVDLRLRGMRWHDITRHYGLSPEIFYVRVVAGESRNEDGPIAEIEIVIDDDD